MSTSGGKRDGSRSARALLAAVALAAASLAARADGADAPAAPESAAPESAAAESAAAESAAAESAAADSATQAKGAASAAGSRTAVSRKHFASPEAATDALVAAARASDPAALLAVLGPDAKPILSSGDPVADEAARKRFLASYDESHQLEPPDDQGEVELVIGEDGWPFPIPLVEDESGWYFDTAQGKEEILDRRIGANELATIEVCRAYVDAQREYAQQTAKGDEPPHYASRIVSSPGKRDGLYWETRGSEPPSPLGPLMAKAQQEGYAKRDAKPVPYHGYYYRVLTKQGPAAAGGAYDYVVRGKMIGGFALVAYPAQYGASGVMTFVVNHDGVVYEKDLGPETAKEAQAMTAFDPDSSWRRVAEDQTVPDAEPAPGDASPRASRVLERRA